MAYRRGALVPLSVRSLVVRQVLEAALRTAVGRGGSTHRRDRSACCAWRAATCLTLDGSFRCSPPGGNRRVARRTLLWGAVRTAHALWHLGIRSDHVGHNRGPADGGCASLASCRACARDPRGVRRSRPSTTGGVTSRPPTIDSFSSPGLVRELSHFLGLHHLIRTSEKVLLRRDVLQL